MNKIKKYVIYTTYTLCVYHFSLLLHYARLRQIESLSTMGSEGSLNTQLSLIHLGMLFSLILYAIFLQGKGLICKIVMLIGGFSALGIYYWWWFEKYLYLEAYGLRIGAADYQIWLNQIGTFRGAPESEYIAFFITILLTLYAVWGLPATHQVTQVSHK